MAFWPPIIKSGSLNASAHLLRGYLRAVQSKDDDDACSSYHLCEAGRSAAAVGHVGHVIVRAARCYTLDIEYDSAFCSFIRDSQSLISDANPFFSAASKWTLIYRKERGAPPLGSTPCLMVWWGRLDYGCVRQSNLRSWGPSLLPSFQHTTTTTPCADLYKCEL